MLKSKFSLVDKEVIEPEAEAIELEEAEDEAAPAVVEEEDTIDYRPLDKDEVRVRLSWIGKTADGEGYTYLKATCTGMKLSSVSVILSFKHLQFVDFSNNLLTTEALQPVIKLPFLLLIHADNNLLASARLEKCKYLQVIIMNSNRLKSVQDVFQPELRTLEVGNNMISEISFINRMPNLKVLDFRNNFIRDLQNLDFPNLDSLYLAGNKIKDLTGIDTLKNLRILHVRNNPIRFLKGFVADLPKLQYLNLRSCKIATLKQVKKLRELTALEALILKNTPLMGGTGKEEPDKAEEEEDPEVRVEVLAALPRLKRLNKAEFTPEERTEAKDLMNTWLEEGDARDDEEELAEELVEEQQQEIPED